MNANDSINIKKRFVILLLSLSLLAFSLIPLSMAWFSPHTKDYSFSAEALLGYFESGDGTQLTPYIVATPKQFYYFSWLQYLDLLPDGVYVEIKEGITEIDMRGTLTGGPNNEESGAIPPIGTTSQPFNGHFNGNGVVIKNLWVSTHSDDWAERPENYDQYSVGTDVGLFGRVEYGAEISNFFLENVEITATVGDNLGIVAGYVDGNISNIGVKNAKISFKEGFSTTVSSNYSLVGYTTQNVYWEDLPNNSTTGGTGGGAGGELLINPSKDHNFTSVSSTTTTIDTLTQIPDSDNDIAFYVPSLTFKQVDVNEDINVFSGNGNSSTPFNVVFENEKTIYTATRSNTYKADTADYSDIFDQSNIWAIYPEVNGTKKAPDFSTVTGKNTFPANSIWFKPIAAGTCSIAFSRTSNGSDEQMSIYRYKRDEDTGKIIEGTIQEIVLTFAGKNQSVGNKTIVAFNHTVTPADLGYEYLIGVSSDESGTSAGLIYLKLAGVNESNGPSSLGSAPDGKPYRILQNIDFVETTDSEDAAFVTLDSIVMHRAIFKLSGTQSGIGAIYFDAANNNIIYYNDASGITMEQLITLEPQVTLAAGPEVFPKRSTTKETTGP